MSSSAVRPVASAAWNIEAGVAEAAVGQRPDQALEPARGPGRQVVDRLEDGPDRAGRRDPGDERGRLGRRTRVGGALVTLRVVDGHARAAVALPPEQRRVGLAVERVAVAGLAGDAADPGRERDHRGLASRSASPSRQAASRRRIVVCAPSAVGAGHDDRELVATDPEGPVGSAQVGGDGRRRLAQQPIADRVAARVVDPLEVVEIDDGQRQRLSVPRRRRPLALHLFLERAMVAEARQRVAQGLRRGPGRTRPRGCVGPPPGAGPARGRAGEPDGQRPEPARPGRPGRASARPSTSRTPRRARR